MMEMLTKEFKVSLKKKEKYTQLFKACGCHLLHSLERKTYLGKMWIFLGMIFKIGKGQPYHPIK